MLGFSEGIYTHVNLPCFFSICAIAPLIIYFHLRLKNMFSKITISLLHYISVFKILLQLFLLINSLLVLRNLISVSFNGLMLPRKSLIFISKKVKGLQSSKKRLKLIQYFKDKIGSTGVLFLQETNSNSKIEQKWIEDFKGQVFFSHGKANSCIVLIPSFGRETFFVKKQELIRKVAF